MEAREVTFKGTPKIVVEPLFGAVGGGKNEGRKWKKMARVGEAMEGVEHDIGHGANGGKRRRGDET